ncbi:MAG TPA: DegV family protein [Lachnospiraceae bacterium]|nr:DegV family protein [Lachnospiraceae bacterium]
MKFKIAMDSAGELTDDLKGREEYSIVPLTLMIGDEEIIDDGTLSQKILVKKIADSPTCPKTACPSPEAYLKEYDCGAEHIYGVTISAELSGSYQSAVIARNMYLETHPDAKIHVFNSRSTSVGETIVVHKITEMENAGVPFEEICETIDAYLVEKRTFFTLDNLETLRKNGRLSRLKALAASVLKIKPICIGNEEGIIEQIDQARGSNRALIKMVGHIVDRTANSEEKILGISYVNCHDRAIMVRDAILQRMKVREVIMVETGGLSTVYANDGGIIVVI